MREKKQKPIRHCDVCGEDVPREKFGRHQYTLGGITAILCRGMKPSFRKAYEIQSLRRLKKARMQARILGYKSPVQVEAFIRGYGYGIDVIPKKKKAKVKA